MTQEDRERPRMGKLGIGQQHTQPHSPSSETHTTTRERRKASRKVARDLNPTLPGTSLPALS